MGLKGREPRKKYVKSSLILGTHAIVRILDGKKTKYTLSLKPSASGKVLAEKQIGARNPDKISFGIIEKQNVRLEFCAYKTTLKPNPNVSDPNIKDISGITIKSYPKGFLLYVDQSWIWLDIDDWRRLFRIMNRIGHFFGVLGRKKAKKKTIT